MPEPRARVLIAEDSTESARLIEYYLDSLGLKHETVGTGEGLLNRARQEKFDLLLIDNSLPDVSGSDVLLRLRESGCSAPAVSISASMAEDDVERYRRAGFTAMLGKPFKREEFLEVVGKFTSSPVRGIAAEAGWGELAGQFAARLPEKVRELVESFGRGDLDKARFVAHKIRGAALFGFEEISQICGKLEEAFKADRTADVPPLLEELQRAVAKLR